MSYIAIGVFTDSSGSSQYSYHAFSSTEPERHSKKIKRDIYYQLGYQEAYPNDKNTFYGWFHYLLELYSDLTIEERGDTIKCVIRPNHTINTDYKILGVNMDYSNPIPQGSGQARVMPHRIIQPNLTLDETFINEDALLDQEDSSSDDE